MKAFSWRFSVLVSRVSVLTIVLLLGVSGIFAQAQATSADLVGSVVDQTGAVIPGATVTVRNSATGIGRSAISSASGEYQFISLPPGTYSVTAEAATFKTISIDNVTLTIGQRFELKIPLEVGGSDITVNVNVTDVELVQTSSSTISTTIDQQRIENLPINERSATGFALTISTVGRDNGRPIGPAPTSGLNIGGQRGRSTLVQVDGADFTDNSVNAARTTVSQEAVQEYQVATNSYAPEFGRATGGIVNVVTKGGTNQYGGNVFGFLRDKNIQARNAFSPIDKPDFRRTQWGGTFGGPIVKDKTHFFLSYERRDRDESGFFTSNPARGLDRSITVGAPILPFTQVFTGLTAAQQAFAQNLLGSGNPAFINAAVQYLYLASSGTSTALTGSNPLMSTGSVPGLPPGTVVGPRFFLSGAPVPSGTTGVNGDLIAFRPLNNLQKVFPVTENTNFFSVRGDHSINDNNRLVMRFGYNTANVTGIQVESQNQSIGQNDFSRTGIQELTDYSFSANLNTVLSSTWLNEFKFSFGKRNATFRSQVGDAVAFNISGAAFIGRELFSPVVRTENRYQFANNVNWIYGDHSFKFGGDYSFVNIPAFTFELNFAGLFNFGPFAAGNLNPGFIALGAPDLTPVQAYGLGLPSTYIQGFGDPAGSLSNTPLAFYFQDTWKVRPNLTFNYGIRYDAELTKQIAPVGVTDPLSGTVMTAADILAAQDAIGVQQGIPRDLNNWAPRLGFAYDLKGDGKTVVRGALGIFFDHPLLAVASNSDIADASQQQQAVLTAGSPSSTSLLNASQVFHGTVCVPGATQTPVCAAQGAGVFTPGVAPTARYQFGRQRFNDQFFTGFGAVLPFTLPITKDFQYASATQANFAVERKLTDNMALSVGYIYVGAHHLPHPTDLNTPNTGLQVQNFSRFAGRNPLNTTEAVGGISIPSNVAPGNPFMNVYGVTCAVVIPGMIAQCPGGRVVVPAIANFFRPNAPNYFLARALSGGAVTQAVLNSQLAGSLRTPGVLSPFGAVNAQASDGNSSYNAMNIELKKRFSNNYTFLASYTWAHSIDDSSDLQTLLLPQNVNDFRAERSDSLFDQRHRFVFSGVLASPLEWRDGDSTWQKIFRDFTIAPIIEISSGRPFNIITNIDTNNDQSSQTDRPNVNSSGVLTVPGPFQTGNLARNRGITHSYANVDMRLTRSIRFGERYKVDLIGEVFNMFNKFNEASVSPFMADVNAFGQRDGGGRFFSQPTAAYDPRQFQLGVKFSF